MRSKMLVVTNCKKETKNKHIFYPFVFCILSSLFASILSITDLEWEAKITILHGTFLFLCGMIFFTSLYYALNYLILHTSLGQRIVKQYKLSVSDVLDISNKNVSAVQALFCCMTGTTICLYSCTRNMLKTSHYISEGYAWFGAAYFFYDIWSMYKVHCAKNLASIGNGNVINSKHKASGGFKSFLIYIRNHAVIVGHHLFIGAFGFLFITWLRGGLGDCFFGFIYLMEASTPFVSARGILSKIGMKDSNLYVVNGVVMLVTFFLCRVAMFPYVIYLYAQSVQLDFISAVFSLPRGCKVSILILLLPQIYWFFLMLSGATKVLKPKLVVNVWSSKKKIIKNAHS